jgi:transcriptional regulator with XRE-family HTH domain
MPRTPSRVQRKIRMFRIVAGLSQEELERRAQVSNLAGIENGSRKPTAAQMARIAAAMGLTVEDCDEVLRDCETRMARNRDTAGGPAPERPAALGHRAFLIQEVLAELDAGFGALDLGEMRRAARAYERAQARDSWQRLRDLTLEDTALVMRSAREYQTWAMVELLCGESADAVPVDVVRAVDLARLAVESVPRLRVMEGWRRRLHGFALAHLAQALRAGGDPEAAQASAEARRLWESGEDPDKILDPSSLF